MSTSLSYMHPDFALFEKYLYDAFGWKCSAVQPAEESTEYGAATCILNTKKILFRVAKITPAKTGQFVAIWKRNAAGITAPFDETDPFDLMIIFTRSEDRAGQFVFTKDVLSAQGIISGKGHTGKRGIRVYPPWDKTAVKQAQHTQAWQLSYFITCSQEADKQCFEMLLQA